jgi:hypothetical protein
MGAMAAMEQVHVPSCRADFAVQLPPGSLSMTLMHGPQMHQLRTPAGLGCCATCLPAMQHQCKHIYLRLVRTRHCCASDQTPLTQLNQMHCVSFTALG